MAEATVEKIVPVAPKVRRSVMGTAALSKLANEDPTKHYVIVNRADQSMRELYEARGYSIERHREGGVRPLGLDPTNVPIGEAITTLEGFLYSIDRELLKEEQSAGYAIMDKIARDMRSPSANALAKMRREDHKYFKESNWTREEGSSLDHGDL